MMQNSGSIQWKIGPKRDAEGNCITEWWGHPCKLDPKHDGMCVMVMDDSIRIVKITEEPGVIVKSGKGYKVKSEGGKNLSKGGLSKAAAEKRLRQVEYFKHKKGGGK